MATVSINLTDKKVKWDDNISITPENMVEEGGLEFNQLTQNSPTTSALVSVGVASLDPMTRR